MDWEGIAGQGLLLLDARGGIRRLGPVAKKILGFDHRCDRGHLEDLPLRGLAEWLEELETVRAAGQTLGEAERELELESAHWIEGRLLFCKCKIVCRLQPQAERKSLLPAWMSLSVVFQETGEEEVGRSVLLPLPQNTAEEDMDKSENKRGMLDGMRVLIAEDFKNNQVLLHFFLEKEGAEITLAGSGQYAVDQAMSGKFDLVFLDDELPGFDSARASRTLRESGFAGPIVVLTPHLDPTAIESYRLAGCTDHLEKPFKSRELREMAENIAKQSQAHGEGEDGSVDRIDDQEFMELINEFVASLDERLHDLESALEKQDWHKIEVISHRLAGTAGIYRLPELSDLGAQIEDLVRAQPGSRSLTQKIEDLATAIHGISGHQLIEDRRE